MIYDDIKFAICILGTILPFLWVFRLKRLGAWIYFSLIIVFLYFYNGLGGCIPKVSITYLLSYIIYMCMLSIVIKKSKLGFNFTAADDLVFTLYIKRKAKKIIYLYFFVSLLTLVFPNFILFRLVSPPSPDVYAALEANWSENDGGAIAQIIYLVKLFLYPFFFWALSKYRRKISKISLLMALDLYISYCHDSYISRYHIFVAILVIGFAYLSNASKIKRLVTFSISIIAAPTLAYFFYQYTFLRHGVDAVNISTSDAMLLLLESETGYPSLYSLYEGFFEPGLIWDYVVWILLLPFPGFMKFGFGKFPTYYFTEIVTGMNPGDSGYAIILPGLVGEALFVFGPILFFLHAVILGLLIKGVYNTFKNCSSLIYVFYYYAVVFSFKLARGGTFSVYPSVMKDFLILSLFLLYIKKHYHLKQIKS